MVTAGTYRKQRYLNTPRRLDLVMHQLFACLAEAGWELHAWAVLSNHYHFIARSAGDPGSLKGIVSKLHMTTAKDLNQEDGTPGRRVWFQYWDTHLTIQTSYLARLKYVIMNPVRHGLVRVPEDHRWCSARWFAENVSRAFYRSVMSFPIDRVNVLDGFDTVPPAG